MQKIIYPAKVPEGEGMEKMFIKISIEAGRLSISGVISPRPNGNSAGGYGQIDMEFMHRLPSGDDSRYSAPTRPEDMQFMPGWGREKWFDLLDIWSKWHLNDMRASCEHQEAEGWEDMAREKVVFYNWVLNDETSQKQSALKEEAITRASSVDPGHTVGFFAEEKGSCVCRILLKQKPRI